MKFYKSFIVALCLSNFAFAEGFVQLYPQTDQIVNDLADNIIIPDYNYMQKASSHLFDTVQALQLDHSQANLRKAQDAWRDIRIGFEISEAHLFGPVVSLRIDPILDSWPLDTEQLAFSVGLTKGLGKEALSQFASSLNENVTGMHAVEYILFGKENDKKIEDFSDEELAYLTLLVGMIKDNATLLEKSWVESTEQESPAYADFLRKSKQGNEIYANSQAAMQEYVSGMLTIINEVGTGKLIDPMGDALATANPALVESQYSWNSTTDFFWNLAGVWQIWYGDSILTGKEALGVRDMVVAQDKALAEKIDAQINKVLEKIVTISYSQYENGSGTILKNTGNIIALAQLIDTDDKEQAFRSQIHLVSGRKRIKQAEEALDALAKSLSEDLLPQL